MPDGRHHAERAEREWTRVFILQRASQIGGKLPGLARRKLGSGRTGLGVPGIRNAGAVADRPDIPATKSAHIRVSFQAASLQWQTERADEWVGRIADGTD